MQPLKSDDVAKPSYSKTYPNERQSEYLPEWGICTTKRKKNNHAPIDLQGSKVATLHAAATGCFPRTLFHCMPTAPISPSAPMMTPTWKTRVSA